MEFKVNSGVWGTMFGVPAIVADNFLKLASAEQIKVLLYVLRHSGNMCSDEEIAVNTGTTPSQVSDAILFWQQANVLSPQQVSAVGMSTQPSIMQSPAAQTGSIMQPTAPVISAQPEIIRDEPSAEVELPKRQNYSGSEIANIMSNSEDIAELFKIAESMLGTLRNNQMNSLIWMYDYLGLKKEVILTLTAYCIKIDKSNPAYIEKIACSWAENDINSLAAAQEEVQRLSSANDYMEKIVKLFEMNRRPSTKEREFIEQWKKDGFSTELIHYAYEKTVEQINKLSFAYISKILDSWKSSGFTDVKSVKAAESAFRSKKDKPDRNYSGSDTDIEKYKQFINKF